MKIISASRRTDIPAFYADWMIDRFREKFVEVINPFNNKIRTVHLDPEKVIAIVFWTKDARPITRHLEEIVNLGHHFTFLYTINNYPKLVEPKVPSVGQTMKVVEHLSKNYGPNALRWRYDTIVLTDTITRAWHINNFNKLCRLLSPFVTECIFSFCDYYKKTRRKMKAALPDYHEPDQGETLEIARELERVASDHGIKMLSCAHDFLAVGPIGKAKCIDAEFLKRLFHSDIRKQLIDKIGKKPSREGCGCIESIDIGRYNTCRHGCVY